MDNKVLNIISLHIQDPQQQRFTDDGQGSFIMYFWFRFHFILVVVEHKCFQSLLFGFPVIFLVVSNLSFKHTLVVFEANCYFKMFRNKYINQFQIVYAFNFRSEIWF